MNEHRVPVPTSERTFRRYLQTLWNGPGFKLTLVSLFTFGILALRRDSVFTLVMLAVGTPPFLALAYRRFRKTGTV